MSIYKYGLLTLFLITSATGLFDNWKLDLSRNACPTWSVYNTRAINSDCWYNGDVKGDLVTLATNKSYKAEAFSVITLDGYNLTLFKITNPKVTLKKEHVLLVHGIFMNAIGWTLGGKGSLAFVLADAGYEVWLANLRGTRYSSHLTLKSSEAAYWDFTPHQMGMLDLPAHINFMKTKILTQPITMVTFSLSGTSALIYSSVQPLHAKLNVKRLINIAPVVYLNNLKSIISLGKSFLWTVLRFILRLFRQYSVLDPQSSISQSISKTFFLGTTLNVQFYRQLMGSIFGVSCQLNSATLAATALNGGDKISLRVTDFYTQIMKTDIFQGYDYGNEAENLKNYGNIKPPVYNLKAITIPVMSIYAENDAIVTAENIQKLSTTLPSPTCVIKASPKAFAHMDFISGKFTPSILYKYIVSDYLPGNCVNQTTADLKCSTLSLE